MTKIAMMITVTMAKIYARLPFLKSSCIYFIHAHNQCSRAWSFLLRHYCFGLSLEQLSARFLLPNPSFDWLVPRSYYLSFALHSRIRLFVSLVSSISNQAR